MAINDYITCCKCDVKLIYDGGKDNNRQWWVERWGKEPEIMCPDCEKKLEPVAYIHETGFLVRNPGANLTAGTKLYAAPISRKPLAEEEIAYAVREISFPSITAIARAIEAAHGIKESI